MFDGYEWPSFVAWGLFFAGVVATTWAGPRLGAKRISLQTVAAPFIAAALVPLLAQPHLTWLGAFTGGTLIAAGLVTAWGSEINERVLLPRQMHCLYTQPIAITALSRSRHRRHIGRVLVALGIALAGGSASYVAIFILFFLADGFSAVREELRLRASGEHTRMVQLFWDSSTTLYFLMIVLIAGSTGGVLDGSLTWVEPGSTIQDSAPLLQALLATTIAVAAIGATATGIALQIRSAGFGGEIALAVVPRRRLLAALPLVSLAALLTVVLLGRWSTLHNEFWGLLPSISVQLSILATVYVLWVTFKSVSSLTRNEPLVAFVGTSVLVADWPEQVRMYGWNAGRGRQLPQLAARDGALAPWGHAPVGRIALRRARLRVDLQRTHAAGDRRARSSCGESAAATDSPPRHSVGLGQGGLLRRPGYRPESPLISPGGAARLQGIPRSARSDAGHCVPRN